MKIAVDLRWIRSPHIDGISRYALNLVSHLLRQDVANDYLLIGQQSILQQHLGPDAIPRIQPINQPLLSVGDFLFTPREIQRLHIDILHVPHYLHAPFGGTYKKILTVYDLIPFLFPAELSKSRLGWRWFYKTRYPAKLLLHSADLIVTTSHNTKRDLERLLHIPPHRIRVVWCGLEARFRPDYAVPESFFRTYHLPSRFLLYVGRQDPYKGLKYLVQAYALLPESLQQTCALVIAGKTDPRYIQDILTASERLQVQPRLHCLDYIPDADLPLLYSAATALIHPSLYEGFGLPPLEAMACGTPVVYADTSSLSELIGDAGLAVPPASADALATGIAQLLQNDQQRTILGNRGLQHVQRYSWSHTALQIAELYQELVQK
ncbi:glycosyltransferase [candidate division KSB3 bacterium]|uniref:Glycosyltransferase n=1 Tax=candidate division KSB3 bacterium TaxID=2044937 RepID=A0A9D5JY51_9BACT|nr:glycosyltransferase [candidate division KSB3 bacterium]MBD3325972.1 glycosyltransferase [candidate division KSB3 bacterium]